MYGILTLMRYVRRIGTRFVTIRSSEWNCSTSFDGFFDASNLVNADIAHEHHVASLQGRSEELLDIGLERLAVHRAFADKWRSNTVVTQRRDECERIPS